jgi:hypothetical protein
MNGEKFVRRATRGAFGASGTSDPHAVHNAILSSCSLRVHITHVCLLRAVLRPKAGASGASFTFLSMRVCRRSVASHARLLACSGAAAGTSGGAASGRTAVLPNPASLACDDASAARLPPTDAGFE